MKSDGERIPRPSAGMEQIGRLREPMCAGSEFVTKVDQRGWRGTAKNFLEKKGILS